MNEWTSSSVRPPVCASVGRSVTVSKSAMLGINGNLKWIHGTKIPLRFSTFVKKFWTDGPSYLSDISRLSFWSPFDLLLTQQWLFSPQIELPVFINFLLQNINQTAWNEPQGPKSSKSTKKHKNCLSACIYFSSVNIITLDLLFLFIYSFGTETCFKMLK